MKMELPKGWILSQLKDVGHVVTGNTPSKKDIEHFGGNIPWIKPGDLLDRKIIKFAETLTESGAAIARLLPPNSVMVSCIGNLGKIGIIDKPATTNQQINSVVFNSLIVNPFFGFYYALTLKEWLYENSSATTVSIINKSRFEKAPIPLPPLSEQQRIVAKLDALFEKLDKIKTHLERIPQLLKDFRQCVLTIAVTGKLDEYIELGDYEINIQTGPFGSALHKKDYIENGIPVINPSHIMEGEIIPNQQVTITESKLNELSRWILEDGDVILGRRGEMGRAAVYFKPNQKMICGTGSVVLKKSPEIDSLFLVYYLRSPFTISYLESNSVGSTMVNLNQKIIKSIPFPKIDINEQRHRIKKIESLFTKADKIELQYQTLKEKIEQLPQAILAKAFLGKLVEQLPTDGDARDLLKEIQKAKTELEKIYKKKTKRIKTRNLQSYEKERMVAEPKGKYK